MGVRASGLLEECFRRSLYRRREGTREDEDVRDRYFKRTSGVLDALEELHTRRCDGDPSQSAAGLSVVDIKCGKEVLQAVVDDVTVYKLSLIYSTKPSIALVVYTLRRAAAAAGWGGVAMFSELHGV